MGTLHSASTTRPESLPPSDELQLQALRALRVLMRAAQRHSSWVEKQCGVSGAQLWLMCELAESPGLRVGEAAARLAVHQTTMSNLLDPLVRRGYVQKGRDRSDGRVVTLALTEDGKALLDNAPQPTRGFLIATLRQLQDGDLLHLLQGLEAMLRTLDGFDEEFGTQPLPFMV